MHEICTFCVVRLSADFRGCFTSITRSSHSVQIGRGLLHFLRESAMHNLSHDRALIVKLEYPKTSICIPLDLHVLLTTTFWWHVALHARALRPLKVSNVVVSSVTHHLVLPEKKEKGCKQSLYIAMLIRFTNRTIGPVHWGPIFIGGKQEHYYVILNIWAPSIQVPL